MECSLRLFLVLITLSILNIVQAQDQQGFISLDCGLPANEPSYYSSDKLWFSSDDKFIQSGKAGQIKENPKGYVKPYDTLRYFPEGIRNCYNLSVEKGRKYLIRATFLYGNYDGLDINPVFDLYLGPNLWATIDLGTYVNGTRRDILHNPTSNSLMICLVKNGTTTPLISSLELRPMGNDSYITKAGSLVRYYWYYLSQSENDIRYSDDVYDRIWLPYFQSEWTQISTALVTDNSNQYMPPKKALRNAATPTNASAPLTIEWTSTNPDDQYYFYAHFAEIQDLQANETRAFNLLWNGVEISGPIIPNKLVVNTIYNPIPRTCGNGECRFQLTRTSNSTLPPLLNAFEVYKVIQFPQSETNETDVYAIKNIADTYELSRNNWQGDPCVPEMFRWDGLHCRNTSMSPRITSLNLSSGGLNGTIAAAIQNLTQLENLDLSNNNLTGEVPEFLGNMKSLVVINLTGNDLYGSIPQALRKKELLVEGNPRLCLADSCRKPPKKKTFVPIVASVASAAFVIAVLVFFLVLKKKTSPTVKDLQLPPRKTLVNATFANSHQPSFDQKKKRFTYLEIIKMTNNFQRVLGKGGFGVVYHGTCFEQVAVKVLSQLTTHGYKQFIAEVDLLLRVHHTNLVSLVGYCYEGDHLALVYEFLPNGNLQQRLRGKRGNLIIDWCSRLRIALEVALGLEYLHIGCSPPMVHRDVKTANILLDEHFKAKLADFGLSKSFPVGVQSQDSSSIIAGTPGYLDPEYYCSGRLGKKSDVYSFGVVLLEMMTNQLVISGNCHITQWVGFRLDRGDIEGIMDPNFYGVYDTNSAWRALELAMSCVDPLCANRPTMSRVIIELKECLVCENSRINKDPSLEAQEMNMSSDTSIVPVVR